MITIQPAAVRQVRIFIPILKFSLMNHILSLFESIRTLVFDVDGVMTDGTLLVMENGDQLRRMHFRDGYMIQLAVTKGYRVVALSGGSSAGVDKRLRYLGLKDVFLGVEDKGEKLTDFLKQHQIDRATVLYMGDDIPDLPPLRLVGLPACPMDAAPEVKSICKYISPHPGGSGCVRDVIEKVLKLNGQWPR